MLGYVVFTTTCDQQPVKSLGMVPTLQKVGVHVRLIPPLNDARAETDWLQMMGGVLYTLSSLKLTAVYLGTYRL